MEKFFLELAKHSIGRPLFVLLSLVALTLSTYHIEKPKAWIGVVASLVVFLVITFAYPRQDEARSVRSSEWFKLITGHLRNASGVCIYLREFDHPDEFKAQHRDALLEINKLFLKGLLEYPDSFRLVAYNETGQATEKATQWLHDGLAEKIGAKDAQMKLDKCVRILKRQPSANSSTVYVIDQEILIYNHVQNSGQTSYYIHFLQRSLIPLLVQSGLDGIFEGAK